mgnify:CR=1
MNYEYDRQNNRTTTKTCAGLTMMYANTEGSDGPVRLTYVHIRENSVHARENNAYLPK